MITEHMTLTTRRDAYQWASECGDLTDAQIERLGDWIWDNTPSHKCAIGEHPISKIEPSRMWEIAGDENHDDYNSAIADGATVIAFRGEKYAVLCQAELSNRVFAGWWGDAKIGGDYTAEWVAPAIGANGRDYKVIWQFYEVKGEENDPDSYDWDDITYAVDA